MSEYEVREKTLTEIWSKTLPQLAPNRLNSFLNYSGAALGLAPLIFGLVPDFTGVALSIVESLSQIYAGLLGFILAGYTIFASVTNPAFLLALWEYRSQENSSMPLLKVHVLVFMRMFITLFISTFLCLFVLVLFKLKPLFALKIALHFYVKLSFQSLILALIGVTISATATQLKILIFNMYDLILTQTKFARIARDKAKDP